MRIFAGLLLVLWLLVFAGGAVSRRHSEVVVHKVATVADLATKRVLNGEQVQALGYYAAGDGGGQVFVYRSTGRAANGITSNRGFYIYGPVADDYFEAIDKTEIWANRWGLLPDGDALNPNGEKWSTVLNAILTAAGSTKTVHVPPGTYTLIDAGQAQAIPILNGTTVQPRIKGYGQCVFKGDASQFFMRPDDDIEVELDGITFDTWTTALFWGNPVATFGNVKITNCKFRNCQRGISDTGGGANYTDFTMTGCDFDGMTQDAFRIRADTWRRVNLSRNKFRNISGSTTTNTALLWGTTGTVTGTSALICENEFDTISTTAASGECHGILFYGPNVNCSNNIVSNVTAPNFGSNSGCEGIYIRAEAGVVADNTLYNAGRSQGHLQVKGGGDSGTNPGATGRYLTVTGNSVFVSSVGPSGEYGINVASASCLIADNWVKGTHNGINAEGNNLKVTGNVVDDFTNIGIQIAGASESDVTDNTVRRGTNFGFSVFVDTSQTVDNLVFSGNTIRDVSGTAMRWHLATAGGNTLSNVIIDDHIVRDCGTGVTVTNAGGGTFSGVRYNGTHYSVTTEESGAKAVAARWVINNVENRAITAAVDPGTAIPSEVRYVTITSTDANHIVVLPSPVVGHVVEGYVGANGCEFYASGSSVKINNVVCSATNEAAMPATSRWRAECVSATDWILTYRTLAGAAGATITPDAR